MKALFFLSFTYNETKYALNFWTINMADKKKSLEVHQAGLSLVYLDPYLFFRLYVKWSIAWLCFTFGVICSRSAFLVQHFKSVLAVITTNGGRNQFLWKMLVIVFFVFVLQILFTVGSIYKLRTPGSQIIFPVSIVWAVVIIKNKYH